MLTFYSKYIYTYIYKKNKKGVKMKKIVNKDELKKIVAKTENEKLAQKEKEKKKADEAQIQENKRIKIRVDQIIASIPEEIQKAAIHAQREKEKLVVTAKIPIVNECLSSIMDSYGHLRDFDERVLQATRQRMKTLKIDEVELSEIYETQTHTYSDSDSDTSGPCKHYYIKASVVIDWSTIHN